MMHLKSRKKTFSLKKLPTSQAIAGGKFNIMPYSDEISPINKKIEIHGNSATTVRLNQMNPQSPQASYGSSKLNTEGNILSQSSSLPEISIKASDAPTPLE